MKMIYLFLSLIISASALAEQTYDSHSFCVPLKDSNGGPNEFAPQLYCAPLNELPNFSKPKGIKGYPFVKTGPSYRSLNPLHSYEYWRYVTFYKRTERSLDHPVFMDHRERCLDGKGFAEIYSEEIFRFQVETSIGISDLINLGFSTHFTAERKISMKRILNGKVGEEAVHTPKLIAYDWEGFTVEQFYDEDNKESVLYLDKKRPFKVKDADYLFDIPRTQIITCR